MIERFYLKNCLTFKEVELELQSGLIVFSGPSGSGKSVLMRSILGSVGFDDPLAEISESSVSWQIDEESTGFENDESNIFKQVKKEKVRYFLNAQSISKKALQAVSKSHMRLLSLKDFSDFEQANMLSVLDQQVNKKESNHLETLDIYRNEFHTYQKAKHEHEQLLAQEKRMQEHKEFAEFELAKIDGINPQKGEYEELLGIKRTLSQKEKAEEKLMLAESIFEKEHLVSEALLSLDVDSAFFDDTMNELRTQFDEARTAFQELENEDIESVLNRLEELSELKRRYGSIDEALRYRDEKAAEVEKYENFDYEKERLIKEVDRLFTDLMDLARDISFKRTEALYDFNKAINSYLKQLYLSGAELSLSHGDCGISGQDILDFHLKGAPLEKVSAGEFNRLRLALLAVQSESMQGQGGVLMLDEIDANLSGEESMSVARVLRQLSKHFQIFVISHQPQLTSMGEQHFIVEKDEESTVRELSLNERIEEIARMISGETVTTEAKNFAKELLESAR
ncbi:MAG: ATPase [Helicobacteraceae bacterium]|jgi:DNA repair protein RecN (Recombination protein N)|nr:ATPase [Helicobacteraceae bacterium]